MIDRPRLHTFESFVQTPLPPISWLVEPLLVRGDRVMFSGEFGAFKSWMLLSLGIHLAAGRDWLQAFKISEPLNVLYIDEEMNYYTLHRRVKQLADGAAITGLDKRLRFYSRVGVNISEYGALRLLDHLKQEQFHPDVVIIETLVRVIMGSENLATDVAMFWKHLEHLMRTGCTVIVSHHLNKPPSEGHIPIRYRVRGSVDLIAGADAGFVVLIQKEGEQSFVKPIKTRGSKLPKAFWINLVADEDGPAFLVHSTSLPEKAQPTDLFS